MIPKQNTIKLVLGKSIFRSHPSFYPYSDYLITTEKYDEKINRYSSFYRHQLKITYPDQGGNYSITWGKYKKALNNDFKIEKIIFRLKPSKSSSLGDSYIYGMNFLTRNNEIKKLVERNQQKKLQGITIKKWWVGKYYEVDFQPTFDQDGNISIASKTYFNHIAMIFLEGIIDDKNAKIQYEKDISSLDFQTINHDEKSLNIHQFFKQNSTQPTSEITTHLNKKIISKS